MELYFGDTPEDERARMQSYMNRIWADAYGVGGFKDMVKFMTTYEATMVEREKQEKERHHSNTTRLNLLIALAMLIVATLGVLIANAALHKSDVIFPEIFHRQSQHRDYTSDKPFPQTASDADTWQEAMR